MHEMNWKAMATQAYDRGDPFEITMMAAAAKQRDGLASDAERWCLENKLSMAEREKNKFMARTFPEWRRAFLSRPHHERHVAAWEERQALQITQFIWSERERAALSSSQSMLLSAQADKLPENKVAIKNMMAAAPRPEARVFLRRAEYDPYWADAHDVASAPFAAYDMGSCAPSFARWDLCWRARVQDWIRQGGSKTTFTDLSTEVMLTTEDPKPLTSKARGVRDWFDDSMVGRRRGVLESQLATNWRVDGESPMPHVRPVHTPGRRVHISRTRSKYADGRVH